MVLRSSSFLSIVVAAAIGCASSAPESAEPAPNADAAIAKEGVDAASSFPADAGPESGPPPIPAVPRYSVPVATKDLEPWSYYAVQGAHGEIRRGTLKLEYVFPVFLTGKPDVVVDLEGPYTPGDTQVVVTAGPYGTGVCDLVGDTWSCREELPGITLDAAGARAAMQAASVPASDIERHLQVTDVFSVDPIGIFEMRAADLVDRSDDD